VTKPIEKQVPLLDLKEQHQTIREQVLAALVRTVGSQRFILGEEVKNFEAEIAAYCGTNFAVGCASGSDALILALMALEIGPGDEVLTTRIHFWQQPGPFRALARCRYLWNGEFSTGIDRWIAQRWSRTRVR
jgi:histidinol-phosphate/aromatic aminotransferase/cobyric acid decarboxylase-like protein